MKIRLIFDISSYAIYIPDGYIYDIKKLRMDFIEWCETQKDAVATAPGNKVAMSISKELFLRYINEVILGESNERAYFLDAKDWCSKNVHKILF